MTILNVKVGAKLMLSNNADVTDGLTNGTMGKVTDIVLEKKY